MITVDAMGDVCPIPVVKAKNAIKSLTEAGEVNVFVDNETAVQNLTKMATQKGYGVRSEVVEKKGDDGKGKYCVYITLSDEQVKEASAGITAGTQEEVSCSCEIVSRKNIVVQITSEVMGQGNPELGKILIKSFVYSLTQLDQLPRTIILYNGGIHLSCEGSPVLEDLKSLEANGVEIITCGTCLQYYNKKDALAVGGVSNMYTIAEKLAGADLIIKP